MDQLLELTSKHFEFLGSKLEEGEKLFQDAEKRLDDALVRARQIMSKKSAANPKPKRPAPMRVMAEDEEEETAEDEDLSTVISEITNTDRPLQSLRPTRTAKVKANANLKEPPMAGKLRNDNNVATYVKPERSSTDRRDSTKENSIPALRRTSSTNKLKDQASDRLKRSESVEVVAASKVVEIDITKDDDDADKMPPPPLVPLTKTKTVRKGRTKKDEKVDDVIMTSSMIKKEKVSIETNQTCNSDNSSILTTTTVVQSSTICETTTSKGKRGKNKKYPMPILVKMEADEAHKNSGSPNSSDEHNINETFDVQTNQVNNQTVTISAAPMNQTVTLEKKSSERNMHDSLMTEDNDDEDEENAAGGTFIIPQPPQAVEQAPPLPPRKKQNEVFNPYIASPIKQKIQAFEKHANQVATPEKYKTLPSSKFLSLKAGTPSKIALFSGKTTPSAMPTRSQMKFGGSCSTLPSSASGKKSSTKLLKKVGSVSQESLDSDKNKQNGIMTALSHQQLLEEKRKMREEKQRLAAQQREALEKEKREQTLRAQIEREEKVRRNLKEKEEKQRAELLKKKMKKEQQLKKLNDEKNQDKLKEKYEYEQNNTALLNATTSSSALNNSMLVKLQKQKMEEARKEAEREKYKDIYCFEMLMTDDSTDDEGEPSMAKRPPPPSWSKKSHRKETIRMQNHVDTHVLDALFSVQPLDVDLREIFPAIDSKKLVRNSSAVWNTPPKRYD